MSKKIREVRIGNLKIGGDNPVMVQSMCNTDTCDTKATINQILALEKEGCEAIRVAVPTMEATFFLKEIKKNINIPLIADIHFDYKIALEAIKQGIDKLRINPGNIGDENKIKKLIKACKENNIPIRIGVNGGSLEKDLLEKYNHQASAEALVESALKHIQILEEQQFYNIVVSLKSSDVKTTVQAYKKLRKIVDYPLHIGVTEAGTLKIGTVKSCIGLGGLLLDGIGETLRVSLTANPVHEVRLAWDILKSLKLRKRGVSLTSCPGCGRTKINLEKIANQVEEYCHNIKTNLHIAVMGCVVNGVGESSHADIGIIGGGNKVALYEKGQFLFSVPEKEAFIAVKKIIDKYIKTV